MALLSSDAFYNSSDGLLDEIYSVVAVPKLLMSLVLIMTVLCSSSLVEAIISSQGKTCWSNFFIKKLNKRSRRPQS